MNYIILDMEWNQPLHPKALITEPITLHAEIVQIGAVKLDAHFREESTFDALITPKYYKKMHKKVASLTGITTDELKEGLPFLNVFERFKQWCGEDFAFLTWGPDDIPVLKSNLTLHSIDTAWIPFSYNLQIIFDRQITHEHRQVSLERALEILNETGEEAHNALNDAKSTAIVCRHLDMDKGINEYASAQKNDTDIGDGTTYRSKGSAVRNKDVNTFECPFCSKEVTCKEFVRQNYDKTLAIATCNCGKDFFVRLKFKKINNRYKVNRMIYPMNLEYEEYYQKKRAQALSAKNKLVFSI